MSMPLRTNQVDYRIHANVDQVPATCEQVDCQRYREGWASGIDESTDLGQAQAYHIRHQSGRSFTEYRGREWNAKMLDAFAAAGRDPGEYTPVPDAVTVFHFAPGQDCFQADEHRMNQAYRPLFLVRDIEGLVRRHSSADPWADDLRTHQDNILGKLD